MNYRNILKNTLSEKSFLMVNKKLIAKYELEAAAFIAYLINQETYWRDEKGKIEFYATDNDIYLFTGINFNRIITTREFLIKEKIIKVELKGNPMSNHYYINHEKILEIISTDESISDIAYNKAIGKITLDSVNNMTIKKLRLVCKQKGVKYTGKDKKTVLATKIIELLQLTENPLTSVQKSCELVNGKSVTNLKQIVKQKKPQNKSKEVVVISLKLSKIIKKAKKNIYVSKAWNERVNNKIVEIAKKYGEDYTVTVLNNLYDNLKSDINKSLVQYINGITKNMKLEEKDVKLKTEEKLQEATKVSPGIFNKKIHTEEIETRKKEYSDEEIDKAVLKVKKDGKYKDLGLNFAKRKESIVNCLIASNYLKKS